MSVARAGFWLAITSVMPRTRVQRSIGYRDRDDRVWSVSEVARLKVVSPAIDGPNVALVIRFEHMGEECFARWLGDGDWCERHRCIARSRAPTTRATGPVWDPRRLRPRGRRCSATFAVFNDARPAGGRAGHRDVLAGL